MHGTGELGGKAGEQLLTRNKPQRAEGGLQAACAQNVEVWGSIKQEAWA